MSQIVIHFDGAIATNHQISMRALGKSLIHLQSAVDRAYLDIKYGSIWKYARISSNDYSETLFLTGIPEEGGFILDFLGQTEAGKTIVQRIKSALRPAIEESMQTGEREIIDFVDQTATRKRQMASGIFKPIVYDQLLEGKSEQITRKYGDRSILKELDQVAAIIRSNVTLEDSAIEITLKGNTSDTYRFDKEMSRKFHQVVSTKSLGEAVVYLVRVTSLDHKNMKGKIYNVNSKKEANIHFVKAENFFKIKPFLGLGEKEVVKIVACPLIEYGAFDPAAGDIYFLDLLQENG